MIDLNKEMNGPGQFWGRFDAKLGSGVSDTWSNDISQEALDLRKQEEQDEITSWSQRKSDMGWVGGVTEASLQTATEAQRDSTRQRV